ncbi:MAG: hypothetical protein RSC84_02645 [Peptostreptococcaceae bacterium]
MGNISVEAKELAREVIFEIRRAQIDKRFHNTKLLMKNYNKLHQHVEDVNGDGYSIYIDEVDFEGGQDVFITSLFRTKTRTAKMLACLDSALILLQKEFEKEKENYKFEAFQMHYIQGRSFEDIAEELAAGKNTPGRWIKDVISRLNILLWGVDALEM